MPIDPDRYVEINAAASPVGAYEPVPPDTRIPDRALTIGGVPVFINGNFILIGA